MLAQISPTRLALLSLLAATAMALLAGGSTAYAKTCSNPNSPAYPSSKGGYYLRLEVARVSCATGKSIMHSHYRCRVRRGGIRGRCTSVRGYTCSEKRTTIPTEINAKVTCRNGARRVIYNYQQVL